MSDLDPKIFKFTFIDILKNIFTTKKSSYENINKINNKQNNKITNINNKQNNKINYSSIS